MQQYFVDCDLHKGDRISLHQEQAHHIQHVMRMKSGENIRIANYHEQVFQAHVEFIQKDVVAVLQEEIVLSPPRVNITLAQALIKGEKWDFLLQKACELGVNAIIPFTSSRCVVKEKEDKKEKKLQRWNKITLEACEQCKRASLVKVEDTIPFTQLANSSHSLKLLAYENADCASASLKDTLRKFSDVKDILCVIGPEGGFDEDEVSYLMNHGFQCVSLGTRILRAETAALSIINSITFYYDN